MSEQGFDSYCMGIAHGALILAVLSWPISQPGTALLALLVGLGALLAASWRTSRGDTGEQPPP